MASRLLIVLVLLTLAAAPALPNGLSLNSIGPKGFGMGGAFVGLANDYTAVYWNPAGITQMQKNFVGVFATDIIPMGTYKLPVAGIDAKTKTNHYISPNIMGSFRFDAPENFTFGLGVYIPAGIGTEWDGSELKNLNGGNVVNWKSKVAVINISPAVAYKFSDQFSLGLAANIFYGMFDLSRPGGGPAQYDESSKGWGYGVTVGALYKPADNFNVGVSFRTKTTVKMSGSATNPAMAALPGAPTSSDFDRDVAWPMWIAGGVAYWPVKDLVLTLDAQFSQWSQSESEFVTSFKDPKWSAAATQTGQNKMSLNWKDATQIRFGVDYTVTEDLDLRAGFYYDPAPAPDETYNILFPSVTYTGISLGIGYKVDAFVFDLGGEYLTGKDRSIDALANPKAMPGTHGMNIPAFSLGVGYMF